MADTNKIKQLGEELDTLLQLRSSSMAIKMLEKEEDIPKEAIRPKKDMGKHVAQCQAFALSRRKGKTVAVLKEDNWCWAPLLSYGLVDIPEFFMEGKAFAPFFVENLDSAAEIAGNFPHFERGKYIGIISAPLKSTSFNPDMVMIYCNNSQLRTILMAVKLKEGKLITSHFDPIDSCVYSVVPVILNREYRITLPDPGDYQRALADEDEIIFSLPIEKLENLVLGLRHFEKMEHGYRNFAKEMFLDFPQPPFYTDLFKKWGLDSPK
jgi:uncharacterized protein (DUF169 family)